jgi:hypothetical protein
VTGLDTAREGSARPLTKSAGNRNRRSAAAGLDTPREGSVQPLTKPTAT